MARKKRLETLLRRERYKYCENPDCKKRFRITNNPDQRYHVASCYKAHRRVKHKAKTNRQALPNDS